MECYALAFQGPWHKEAPPAPFPIMDACKQGSEKTNHALVIDISGRSSPPTPPTPHLQPPPLRCMSATDGNSGIMAAVDRLFNKRQHVFSPIITHKPTTKPELGSNSDSLHVHKSLNAEYD